jgi:phosphate-selective porin
MTNSIGSLLALAVTTSVALANGGGGDDDKKNPYQDKKWQPGTGITLSDTDEFRLNILNYMQFQWVYTDNDNAPDTNTFLVRRARTNLTGHIFDKNLTYKLGLEWTDNTAGNGAIKDAWANYNFVHETDTRVGVRVGQSKTGFGLESTGNDVYVYFVERSAATRTFSENRSRGAWAYGSHNENKLRWNAGLQNGDQAAGAGGVFENGEEKNNPDNALNFMGNVSFDPMGDVMGGGTNESFKQGDVDGKYKDLMGTIGGGVEIGNNRNVGNTSDVQSTAININTAWYFGEVGTGYLTAQGEVFLRTDNPSAPGPSEDSTGWYAQGTYTLPKSGESTMQWGFGFRINMIDTDDTNAFLNTIPGLAIAQPGKVTEVSAVACAFYHGHNCKTQIEYTWQDVNPDAGGVSNSTNHIFRVQFQIVF